MKNWQEYNKNNLNLSKKLIKHNKLNNFNYIEDLFYNHIRDLLALNISLSNKNSLKILDYGSNLSTWSNLKNKINTDNIEVTIFDPFSTENYSKELELNFPVNVISSDKDLKSKKFDLTIFSSSSQYINNFYQTVLKENYILSEQIFFMATPFSLSTEFFHNQKIGGFESKQYIRSFEMFSKEMFLNNYEVVFKSLLPESTSSYNKVNENNKIISLNILFRKRF